MRIGRARIMFPKTQRTNAVFASLVERSIAATRTRLQQLERSLDFVDDAEPREARFEELVDHAEIPAPERDAEDRIVARVVGRTVGLVGCRREFVLRCVGSSS